MSETSGCARLGRMMKIKSPLLRQFFAEFLGTFVLIMLGDGAIAQWKLTAPSFGSFFTVSVGYGFGLAFGIYMSAGVSGGHLNPAVTLTMAIFRRLKWKQVPVYWAGQYLGAFTGAAVLYGIYYDLLKIQPLDGLRVPDDAGIFATYPNPHINTGTQFGNELVGTAFLVLVIFAVTDPRNTAPSPGVAPLLIGLGLLGIFGTFGANTGSSLNPARDFAPRLLTVCAGYGSHVFSNGHWYFWVPIVAPHCGALLGGSMYYCLVEHHWPSEATSYDVEQAISSKTEDINENKSIKDEAELDVPRDSEITRTAAMSAALSENPQKKPVAVTPVGPGQV